MKYVLDSSGKQLNYLHSVAGVEYQCPSCHDVLIRKVSQNNNVYFSHRPNRACMPIKDQIRSGIARIDKIVCTNHKVIVLVTLTPNATFNELKKYFLHENAILFCSKDIHHFFEIKDKLLVRYLLTLQMGLWLSYFDGVYKVDYIVEEKTFKNFNFYEEIEDVIQYYGKALLHKSINPRQ